MSKEEYLDLLIEAWNVTERITKTFHALYQTSHYTIMLELIDEV